MKKKKTFKGMTLIEVIIAMVVMVVASALLVLGAVSIINNTRTARRVVNKVNEQAPVVENEAVVSAYVTGENLELQIVGAAEEYTLQVDKFEAPTTQAPEDERSGNLRYFRPVSGT